MMNKELTMQDISAAVADLSTGKPPAKPPVKNLRHQCFPTSDLTTEFKIRDDKSTNARRFVVISGTGMMGKAYANVQIEEAQLRFMLKELERLALD